MLCGFFVRIYVCAFVGFLNKMTAAVPFKHTKIQIALNKDGKLYVVA